MKIFGYFLLAFGLLPVTESFAAKCVLRVKVPEIALEFSQTSLGKDRDIATCVYEITRAIDKSSFAGQIGKIKQFQDNEGFGDDAQIAMFDYCIQQACPEKK
jgi:hypothetical protein